jgi:hypothetical protein
MELKAAGRLSTLRGPLSMIFRLRVRSFGV